MWSSHDKKRGHLSCPGHPHSVPRPLLTRLRLPAVPRVKLTRHTFGRMPLPYPKHRAEHANNYQVPQSTSTPVFGINSTCTISKFQGLSHASINYKPPPPHPPLPRTQKLTHFVRPFDYGHLYISGRTIQLTTRANGQKRMIFPFPFCFVPQAVNTRHSFAYCFLSLLRKTAKEKGPHITGHTHAFLARTLCTTYTARTHPPAVSARNLVARQRGPILHHREPIYTPSRLDAPPPPPINPGKSPGIPTASV